MEARLPAWSLFAGVLAAAGLPIYIHAPKFYADQYGVGLAALGAVLFGLRLFDVVQDPLLGWLSERLRHRRARAVALAAGVMACAMLGLFAVTPPMAPLLWFALTLTALFSAYSFLSITFYAEGVSRAATLSGGHVRLAGWREAGALLGVSLAAVAPLALGGSFAAFAVLFAALALIAILWMHREWGAATGAPTTGLAEIARDATLRRLLLLALVNATPLAVTSTLFLFFVEVRLALPGWEGPLLVLFFLSAAASAPLLSRAAAAFGTRRALLAAMLLAIAAFAFAACLVPGDLAAFAAICFATGIALGADATLLPAAFAARLAVIAPAAATGFGLWSFVTKITLSLAAAVLLPALAAAGFRSGEPSPPEALAMLTLLYALVPLGLKCIALGLLAFTPLDEVPT